MLVALTCRDRTDGLPIRMATRTAHLEHIERSGVVAMAGPLLDPEGKMTGSLIVLDVPSLAEARAWAEADPYAKAGLFDEVRIEEWKKVVG
jgi:uncharacterized protein